MIGPWHDHNLTSKIPLASINRLFKCHMLQSLKDPVVSRNSKWRQCACHLVKWIGWPVAALTFPEMEVSCHLVTGPVYLAGETLTCRVSVVNNASTSQVLGTIYWYWMEMAKTQPLFYFVPHDSHSQVGLSTYNSKSELQGSCLGFC